MLVPCYGKFDIWLWIEGNQKISELISTYNIAFLFAASIFTKKVMMEIGKIQKILLFQKKINLSKKIMLLQMIFFLHVVIAAQIVVLVSSPTLCLFCFAFFFFAKKLLFIYSSQGCLTNNSSFVNIVKPVIFHTRGLINFFWNREISMKLFFISFYKEATKKEMWGYFSDLSLFLCISLRKLRL